MSGHHANVLVHVDEILETEEFVALQGALGHIEGVAQVSPSALPKLVRVDYDPGKTVAKAILDQVRRQGLQARLVGM